MQKGIVTYSQLGKNGRLGNQLFQIATTIAYSLDTGRDNCFPLWEYNKYMECILPIGSLPDAHRYNEPHFHYEKIPALISHRAIDLHGYFQSEKYFNHRRKEILAAFAPTEETWNAAFRYFMSKTMEHQYNSSDIQTHTCSIHVRRGDYAKNAHTNEYHGLLGMEYYRRAVAALRADVRDTLFLIFSDDIDWCKEHFTEDEFPNLIFIEGNLDIVDLFIMSMCRWNIIANSSFSWWGHYLNTDPQKKCVAPAQWFATAPLDPKDVYPSNAILV